MSINPNYASIPVNKISTLSVANAGRDGTGTLVSVIDGGVAGVVVQDIMICATGNTTVGFINIYLSDGTNNNLVLEHPVTVVTASATVAAWSTFLSDLNWVIMPGWELSASTQKSEVFKVSVLRSSAF